MTPAEVARRLPMAVSPDEIGTLCRKGLVPGATKLANGRWVLPPWSVRLVAQRLAARRGGTGV